MFVVWAPGYFRSLCFRDSCVTAK